MAKIDEIKGMRGLLTDFFCVAVSAHVAHLNTRSFAAHKALGEFYDFANDFRDRLIEYMVGQGYVNQIQIDSVEADEDVVGEAQDALNMLSQFANQKGDETLKNMSADFQEALGKLKYMLMLK